MLKKSKIVKRNIFFYEDNVANKVTETLRKETDAQPLKFYNMESLNKDQQNDKDLSYQSLMKENIKNIDKALSNNTKQNSNTTLSPQSND